MDNNTYIHISSGILSLQGIDKSVSVSIPLHCHVLKDLKNGSKPDVLFDFKKELFLSFVDTTIPF